MKVFIYSAKPFEIPLLTEANNDNHYLEFTTRRLDLETAQMALNFDAISIFSADDASIDVLKKLHNLGVKYITLRSAGHDNINLKSAHKLGFKVANTPHYSPNAIAEHAITLLLALNRHILIAQHQTLQHNFSLDKLIGFDLHKKAVGVMGTGNIGAVLVKILSGFGCKVLANDTSINKLLVHTYDVEYISKSAIANEAEIIFITLPLTSETHYLFNEAYLKQLKKKPIIINVARGAIVETNEMLDALDRGTVTAYGTDVYEHEHGIFFYDRSKVTLKDRVLHRLLCHPKTLVTPHQAFATNEALQNIASTTIENLNAWETGKDSNNELY